MDIRRNLRQSYDNHAAERDGRQPQDWKIEVRERFMEMLALKQTRTLIDIGAGTGRDSRYFMEQGIRVTAVDLSDEMVRLCAGKGVEAFQLDYCDLRELDRKYDAAWAMNSLLHVEKAKLRGVLDGISGVLNPSGLFFMGVYGGDRETEGIWPDDPYTPKRFFSFFTDEGIQDAVSGAFDIIRFDRVETGEEHHFQSIVMRRR